MKVFHEACLDEARKAKSICRPNPAVGAVLVHNGKIISRGHTQAFGQEHAEVVAIQQLPESFPASELHLYVSLTPCSHYGKTPPCCDLIIEKKIAHVHIANLDLNPLVAKSAIERLRNAGCKIHFDFPLGIQEQLFYLNADFFLSQSLKHPLLIAKAALTLDGMMCDHKGKSQWITSPESRTHVHQRRSEVDAILVGGNTFLTDKPRLNARVPHKHKEPLAIVWHPPEASRRQWEALNKRWLLIHPEQEALMPHPETCDHRVQAEFSESFLKYLLEEKGIQSLYIEGGPRLHSHLFERGMYDILELYIAPKILAAKGLRPFESETEGDMSELKSLKVLERRVFAEDQYLRVLVKPSIQRLFEEQVASSKTP